MKHHSKGEDSNEQKTEEVAGTSAQASGCSFNRMFGTRHRSRIDNAGLIRGRWACGCASLVLMTGRSYALAAFDSKTGDRLAYTHHEYDKLRQFLTTTLASQSITRVVETASYVWTDHGGNLRAGEEQVWPRRVCVTARKMPLQAVQV